jgi:hypothetical protein
MKKKMQNPERSSTRAAAGAAHSQAANPAAADPESGVNDPVSENRISDSMALDPQNAREEGT